MKWPHDIDSGGGHILVALFVFLVGVALVASTSSLDLGREVTIAALASLWTAIKSEKREGEK